MRWLKLVSLPWVPVQPACPHPPFFPSLSLVGLVDFGHCLEPADIYLLTESFLATLASPVLTCCETHLLTAL